MISRADTTGGTRDEKETDDGFDQLFSVYDFIPILILLAH